MMMRNIGFMAASTAVRLVMGLLTFWIMTRVLGAEEFGRLMTAFGAAVLVGIVANFGLSSYVLREMGAASTESAKRIMSEVMSAKLILVTTLLVLSLLVVPWLPAPWDVLVAMMLLAQLFDAFTDLLNVGFRATGRFSSETRITTAASLLQLLAVGGALYLWPYPTVAAAAYCTARGVAFAMTWLGQRDFFGGLRIGSWKNGVATLKAASAYAVDMGLLLMFGQVDSLVIAHFFGPSAVGQYQAGMRLFLGAWQSTSVLGNVAIPRLAALRSQGVDRSDVSGRVQLGFTAIGIVGGLMFTSVSRDVVVIAFGVDYAALSGLLPWFGLLFLIRLQSASFGTLLTIAGHQNARATLAAGHWIVVAMLVLILLPESGLVGWIYALIAGNIALCIAYALVLLRSRENDIQLAPVLLSTVAAIGLLAVAIVRTQR